MSIRGVNVKISTNRIEEAESLIKKVMIGDIATERALEICRWLLSFNGKESFHVKCYLTGDETDDPKNQKTTKKRPDVRFCIDRGNDCLGEKIMTNFLVVEPNFEIMGLYSKNHDKPYLKQDKSRWRVGSKDTLNLDLEEIKKLILESYYIKLNSLNLDSTISTRL